MVSLPLCTLAMPLLYRAFVLAAQPPERHRRRLRARPSRLRAGGDDAALAALDAAAHEGNQLAPELDRVLERVESADQHRAGTGVVVVEQGFGDLLGGPDQRRGAPGGSRGGGDRRPEALVVYLAPA